MFYVTVSYQADHSANKLKEVQDACRLSQMRLLLDSLFVYDRSLISCILDTLNTISEVAIIGHT